MDTVGRLRSLNFDLVRTGPAWLCGLSRHAESLLSSVPTTSLAGGWGISRFGYGNEEASWCRIMTGVSFGDRSEDIVIGVVGCRLGDWSKDRPDGAAILVNRFDFAGWLCCGWKFWVSIGIASSLAKALPRSCVINHLVSSDGILVLLSGSGRSDRVRHVMHSISSVLVHNRLSHLGGASNSMSRAECSNGTPHSRRQCLTTCILKQNQQTTRIR